jgi:hypothetical protein
MASVLLARSKGVMLQKIRPDISNLTSQLQMGLDFTPADHNNARHLT